MSQFTSQRFVRTSVALLVATVVGQGSVAGQEKAVGQGTISKQENQVLKVTAIDLQPGLEPAAHPLAETVRLAEQTYNSIQERVYDYTCLLVKRERIDGMLGDYEYMAVKLRSERRSGGKVITPFSVYLKYLAPRKFKGREAIYVAGANDGDMLARKGGRRASYLDFWLDPKGRLAMRDNRYSITEMGIENLVKRLIEAANADMEYREVIVKTYERAKLDGRICTVYEVTHPIQRKHFSFHIARIFFDDELRLPIRYASYTWPDPDEDEVGPQLVEEYTYRKLKMNVGLSDADFDYKNPEYGFSKS